MLSTIPQISISARFAFRILATSFEFRAINNSAGFISSPALLHSLKYNSQINRKLLPSTARKDCMIKQPVVYSEGKRPFYAYPAAIQAMIINDQQEILLLHSPKRNQANEWQVVSGGVEHNETFLDAALREAGEEAGANLQLRPLGIVHAQTFKYDNNVPYMMSVHYLLHYLGGIVEPGDDMRDATCRWWSLDELAKNDIIYHPSTSYWHIHRAIQLWQLWQQNPPEIAVLQSPNLG